MLNAWIALVENEQSTLFMDWFQGSKVVDKSGSPLIVYHGTPDVRHILQYGFRESSHRSSVYFFSDNYSVANTYADDRRAFDYQNAEPHTIPVFLKITNPMVIDANGQKWSNTEHFIEDAQKSGHDGLIIKRSRDEYNDIKSGGKLSTVYCAFSKSQIKSAIRTNLKSRVNGDDLGRGSPEYPPIED